MNGAYAALAGRLVTSLNDLQVVVTRVQALADKALITGDDDYWDGIALNLHGFYGGVERLLEDIARTVEESVPAGPGWRQDLLMQMSAEVPGMRPPVILMGTRACLDEYRGFRHVVRNIYAYNLRPWRMKDLVAELPVCYQSIQHDLADFIMFLEQVAEVGK